MPKFTQLVKEWVEIRVIMANICRLVNHSIRLSILVYDLTEVSQQLFEVSIISPVYKGGTGSFRNPVRN